MNRYVTAAYAIGLYLVWTGATWFLEGRIETLRRPEAVLDRLTYAIFANWLIGTAGALALAALLNRKGMLGRSAFGFGDRVPSLTALAAALALAFVFIATVLGGSAMQPLVLVNAFAQVLVVSTAEVLVCWTLVGAAFEQAVEPHGRAPAVIAGALAASLLFGVYHFAHSAPFDTVPMVAFLSVIGLVTSAFFFITRDAYATIVFHNALGMAGVVQAIDAAGRLESFTVLQPALVLMAMATAVTLALLHRWLLR